ncbi:MAG: hypothetical protein IJ169_07465 [Paludibacteraceae bacterium]|nr:hypothetical protein [Paludibacteraceae bacterium]
MKTKALLVITLCALPVLGCSAQKVKKQKAMKDTHLEASAGEMRKKAKEQPVAEEPEPVITEECLINVSLFNESAKNKQYADAVEPWYDVYTNCPNANKVIYTRGPQIIEWQYKNAKTDEEKQQLRNTLMQMYDKRIKYFGDDDKYPTPYILGLKGLDYCEYFAEDALKLPAYEWMKKSIEGMGEQSQLNVLSKFAELSNGLFKSDADKYAEQYIADYQKVTDLLGKIAANPANKFAENAKQYKDYIDGVFAASGAADCAKLDELYAQTVKDNSGNLEMLGKVMKLYRHVGCTESDVYFAAAESSHKLQPTAESAAGCAAMSAKKGNYKDALAYYDQAAELAEDADDKANYLYNNAVYAFNNLSQYSVARQYARRSLEVKPDQGRCYLLIGLMYASSKPFDDAVLNKSVFWAAVDKFVKAKTVDPSVTDEANKLINSYSKYFPTTEEIFFNAGAGMVKGKPYTVGGWIGETTICR